TRELEGPGRGMAFVLTCGLSELVLLPRDLCRAGRDVIVGRRIRFFYDESGGVTGHQIDGDRTFPNRGAAVADPRVDVGPTGAHCGATPAFDLYGCLGYTDEVSNSPDRKQGRARIEADKSSHG